MSANTSFFWESESDLEDDTLFDNSKTLQLIYLVKRIPLLWAKKHPDYKNENLRSSAWNTVATKLDRDVDVCQKKWKDLLATYSINRKKDLDARRNKIYIEKVHRPSWFAYKHMSYVGKALDRARVGRAKAKSQMQSSENPSTSATYSKQIDGCMAIDDENPSQEQAQSSKPCEECLLAQSSGIGYYEPMVNSAATFAPTSHAAKGPGQKENHLEIRTQTLSYKLSTPQHSFEKERQYVAPFIELLTQRMIRKERSQLEQIKNALLKVIDNFPDGNNH